MQSVEVITPESSAQAEESGNFFELWQHFRNFKEAQQKGSSEDVLRDLRIRALGMAARLQTLRHLEAEIEFNPEWAEAYGKPTRIEGRSPTARIRNHFIRWVVDPYVVKDVDVSSGQDTLNLYLHKSIVPQDIYDVGNFAKVDLLQPGVDFRITDEEFARGREALEDDELKDTILIHSGQHVSAVTLGTFRERPVHQTQELTEVNNVQFTVSGVDLDHNGLAVVDGEFVQGGEDGSAQIILGSLKYARLKL